MLSLSTLSLSLSIPFPILILTSFHTRIFSNERLHTHRVMVTAPAVLAAAASAPSTVPRYFQSQVEMTGKKRMHPENVAAIKNRFLELFIYRRPPQDERDLELCDCFNRKHFIVGTFERALALLEKHQPSDFHGPALYAYVISALGKNAPLVEQVTSGDQEHYMRIHRLAAKYNV
jgi:hypothetical protein